MGGAQLLHTRTPTQLPFTNAQKGHHMPEPDARTANTIIRQWEKLESIKHKLIKAGMLSGDAAPAAIIAKLRETIPADLFR